MLIEYSKMRILLVNACHKTQSGLDYYQACVKLITGIIMKQKYVSDTELDLIERDPKSLEEYLYELETSHSSILVICFLTLGYAKF
jgi:hypothetical protein